jgi:hypothetical protein
VYLVLPNTLHKYSNIIANELQEIIDGLLLEVAQADLLKAGEKQC